MTDEAMWKLSVEVPVSTESRFCWCLPPPLSVDIQTEGTRCPVKLHDILFINAVLHRERAITYLHFLVLPEDLTHGSQSPSDSQLLYVLLMNLSK